MQRKHNSLSRMVCCAAGLLIGATAHAQSSVTLYGLMDGGLLYTSRTLGSTAGRSFPQLTAGPNLRSSV
jgi:predicted porin